MESRERYFRNIIAGSNQSLTAGGLLLAFSAIEPFYSGVTTVRNKLYDAGTLPAVRLNHPVISIGNITTGGTGKTPMVRWLADQLRQRGRSVAILSRGYKSSPGSLGDEQLMLDRMLNGNGQKPVIIAANPNRSLAARSALQQQPGIDTFLLDDGFQHRQIARDLDIVLLDAGNPFGFCHVLPRGLLREPMRGLRRAGAIVITHLEHSDHALAAIESQIREWSPTVPIYRAMHAQTGLRSQGASPALACDRSLDELRHKRFFVFCGIGNPDAFISQLVPYGDNYVGHRRFADHHAYRDSDLDELRAEANAKHADMLLTTEKDWVKVMRLANISAPGPEICRVDVEMQLMEDDGDRLLKQVCDVF